MIFFFFFLFVMNRNEWIIKALHVLVHQLAIFIIFWQSFSKRTNLATDKKQWRFFQFMKHNFYKGFNLVSSVLFCMQY